MAMINLIKYTLKPVCMHLDDALWHVLGHLRVE